MINDNTSKPKPVPVLVQFPLTDENWKLVVLEAKSVENVSNPTKGDDFFYVAYPDQRSYTFARVRCFSLVPHKVVNEPFSNP